MALLCWLACWLMVVSTINASYFRGMIISVKPVTGSTNSFVRPNLSSYIRFFTGEKEVYRLDSATSGNISNRTLHFQTQLAPKEKTRYYILLDRGVVKGTSYCGAQSNALYDKTYWQFSTDDKYMVESGSTLLEQLMQNVGQVNIHQANINCSTKSKRIKRGVSSPRVRVRRNIWQFGRLIKCVTDRGALDYNNYGCWCGRGGGGPTMDGTDRCCKVHDHCYNAVEENGCRPKWGTYDYNKNCPNAWCTDPRGTCDRKICDCDLQAAICFSQNIYNEDNKRTYRNRNSNRFSACL